MKFKAKKPAPDQLGLGWSVEEMTRVPDTDWTPPDLSSLPDRLPGPISVDTETRDDGLNSEQGAGWAWPGGGHVAGYSVAAGGFRTYLPVGHAGGGNVDAGRARRWLNHILGDPSQTKIFANAMYDLSWAKNDGVDIRGPVIDVQLVEALLDENRYQYSLGSIAKDRVGRDKDERLLNEAAKAYGFHPKKDLWRLPARFVGTYAEADADLPLQIWAAQEPLVRDQGLGEMVALEHGLLPMYMSMRRRGVRVDVPYVEELLGVLRGNVTELVGEIKRRTGHEVNIWAAASIAKALQSEGITYPMTNAKKPVPSITKEWLERQRHWLTDLVIKAREADKLIGTFVEGQILHQLHGDNRVHAEIHPLKSDDGGTVTGRLSMSDPNLQFIPVRTKEGAAIRRAFLPEEGRLWGSCDFSQQEPRLVVHFASLVNLPGAAEARDAFQDPEFSYHKFAAELTGLEYKAAKILNLAIIYGRGVPATAAQLEVSVDETKAMFSRHAEEMPFVRGLSDQCQRVVNQRGWIKSLLGRRARFPFFEPRDWDLRDGRMLTEEAARQAWPGERLTRARIHKALNSLIQPSAADMTKKAMLCVWEAGLGEDVMIQVHDELCCSVTDRGHAEGIARIMADAVRLAVPVRVDTEVGPNWRDAE